jgi:hypothetical protein
MKKPSKRYIAMNRSICVCPNIDCHYVDEQFLKRLNVGGFWRQF